MEKEGDYSVSHNIEKNLKEDILVPLLVEYNKNFSLSNTHRLAVEKVYYLQNSMHFLIQIISEILPDVESYQYQKWANTFKKEADRKENKYEDWQTDVTDLMVILNNLLKHAREMDECQKTDTLKDDFVEKRIDVEGKIITYVSDRYYNYKQILLMSYMDVSKIMNNNGIKRYQKDEAYSEKSLDEEIDDAFAI